MLLQMMVFHSFNGWSNIPWYHIFTHSSANGPLGCVCVLAIVNNGAMNAEVCMCPFDYSFPDICQPWDCKVSLVALFLVF